MSATGHSRYPWLYQTHDGGGTRSPMDGHANEAPLHASCGRLLPGGIPTANWAMGQAAPGGGACAIDQAAYTHPQRGHRLV